jgi:hypothetical protein
MSAGGIDQHEEDVAGCINPPALDTDVMGFGRLGNLARGAACHIAREDLGPYGLTDKAAAVIERAMTMSGHWERPNAPNDPNDPNVMRSE